MAKPLLGALFLPIGLMIGGLWEGARSHSDVAEAVRQRDQLAPVVAALQARQAQNPAARFDMGLEFQRGGTLYAGPLAVTEAQDALANSQSAVWLAQLRTWLPPLVTTCAGIAAGLSAAILCLSIVLGRAGRRSRERLLSGFSVMRRLLPPVMGAQVVLMAMAFVTAVGFESGALLDVDAFSAGGIKLLAIGVIVAAISLWTAARAVLQLRRAVAVFRPDPLRVDGRLISPPEAPGLWDLLHSLAGRIGALPPENVVVGLTGGFFVSSGPKQLYPSNAAIAGRTLYLPLPALPLLRADEAAAIIGHELAHFSGGDTEWSQRFLPIYAGVERSLDAVATAATGSHGTPSPLISPSLRLGLFVMDQFHAAVLHWSRLREFAADAAGAAATSPEAAARALLRTAALQPRIEDVLSRTAEAPDTAPDDLVSAVLQQAMAIGLDDPAAYLEAEQPHPTDTHPATRQRLAALGQPPTPELLAEAALAPMPADIARLSALFIDPPGLCRAATADFIAGLRAQRLAHCAALQATADRVGQEERALHENTRGPAVLNAAAAVLGLAALALLGFGLHGLDGFEQDVIAASMLLLAALLAMRAALLIRRARVPFMLLRPDSLALPGLDRPIAWDELADLDVTVTRSGIVTRMLLPPEVVFPARLPGARRLRLDTKRGIVTLKAAAARGMTAQAYAALLGQYRQAAMVRRVLQDHPPETAGPTMR